MHERDDLLWEWSVFWQSDQLQSCMPVSEPGASDRLLSTWQEFFNSLSAGARILDLGTGNGSLASQAVTASKSKTERFSIHGVDLADIDPSRFVSSAASLLEEITFHPRTAMEKLPFADSYFDAVVSQYALEYSQIDKSLAESLRVLRPQGRFRFLLHSDNGVLKKRCESQRKQAETILDSELFKRLADVLAKIINAEQRETPQTLACATESLTALKDAFDDLEQQFSHCEDRSLVDNLFIAVRRLPSFRKSYDLPTLLTMADDIRKLLIAQAKRLQAMAHAALDDAAVAELVELLRNIRATEVKLERATAGEGQVCIGHWLFGEKAVDETQSC